MKTNNMRKIFTLNNIEALQSTLTELTGQSYQADLTAECNIKLFNDCSSLEVNNDKIVNAKNLPLETLVDFLPKVAKRLQKTETMLNFLTN